MASVNREKYITADVLAAEIRQCKSKLSVVVEGHGDILFFERFTDAYQCGLFDACGKENVIGVCKTLNADPSYELPYLGIVDKDFDLIIHGENLTYPDNVYSTDAHDREIMCFTDNVFESLYIEYLADKKRKSKEWLKEHILCDARVFGYLQLANHIENWNMTTKKGEDDYMDFSKFYGKTNELISYKEIALKIHSNHPVANFNADTVAAKMTEIEAQGHPNDQLLNGHHLALIYLEYVSMYGNKDNTYKRDRVEREIRLAYSLEEFHSTTLYAQLKAVQDSIGINFLR